MAKAKPAKKPKRRTVIKDASSGKFESKQYAKDNPGTTYKERVADRPKAK